MVMLVILCNIKAGYSKLKSYQMNFHQWNSYHKLEQESSSLFLAHVVFSVNSHHRIPLHMLDNDASVHLQVLFDIFCIPKI